MKILVIEDEKQLVNLIQSTLIKEGYEVNYSLDGKTGYNRLIQEDYDLVILDVMLPSLNGFEILEKIKEDNIDCKVIVLSARSALEDKLTGLENGANDYMTKPFHIEELIARVHVQLGKNQKIRFADLELDMLSSKLICLETKESVELILKEYKLMKLLMINHQQILSKDLLYEKVWGFDNDSESNNLEVYISFLRRKIKAIGSKVKIQAHRGLGYQLKKD